MGDLETQMLRTSGSRSALPVPTVLAVVRRRPFPASSAPTVPLGQGSGGHVPAGPSACRPLAGRRTRRFASQGASQGALLREFLPSRGRGPHRAQAASQCARSPSRPPCTATRRARRCGEGFSSGRARPFLPQLPLPEATASTEVTGVLSGSYPGGPPLVGWGYIRPLDAREKHRPAS